MDERLLSTEAVRSDTGAIVWTYRVPLLTSRFMLWDFVRVIVLSLLVMFVLVAVAGWLAEGELVILPLQVLAMVGAIMFALLLIAALLLGNHMTMTFTVDADGVAYASGSRERKWNRAAFIIGALAGSASTAGAGLLASSNEQGGWEWVDLYAARYFPAQHVISLRNSWRTVLRLHCTAEDYGRVRAAVESGLASGDAERATRAPEAPRARRPFRDYLVIVLVPVVAAVLVMAWPWLQYEEGMRILVFAPLLLIGAALAPSGCLGRALAAFSLVLTLVVVYFTVREMGPVPAGVLSGERFYGWELDTGLLAVTLVAEAVLVGLAVWRLFGRTRVEDDD